MKSNKRIVLTNENPSNVDIELFNYSGYFLYHIENIDKYLRLKKYKYVRINYHRKVDKNSIRRIVVNEEDIDLNNMIIFDEKVEWVYYSNAYEDQELLLILLAKTIELGWNQFSRYSQTSMKVIKEFLSANNK